MEQEFPLGIQKLKLIKLEWGFRGNFEGPDTHRPTTFQTAIHTPRLANVPVATHTAFGCAGSHRDSISQTGDVRVMARTQDLPVCEKIERVKLFSMYR